MEGTYLFLNGIQPFLIYTKNRVIASTHFKYFQNIDSDCIDILEYFFSIVC